MQELGSTFSNLKPKAQTINEVMTPKKPYDIPNLIQKKFPMIRLDNSRIEDQIQKIINLVKP